MENENVKEIEIPEKFVKKEWKTNKVKIRKWGMRLRNRIMSQCTDVKITPGAGKGRAAQVNDMKLDWGELQIQTIMNCVIEAPWPVMNISVFDVMDPGLGDHLFNEIDDFNEGDIKNLTGSEESSEEKQSQTQQKNEQSSNTKSQE